MPPLPRLPTLPETLRGAREYGDVVYGVILLGAFVLAPKGIVGSLALLVRRRDAKGSLT